MNSEDATIAAAVGKQRDSIAQAIEVIADRLRSGGRLIYIGAGTSGRLGVLDASECPPTFNTDPSQVVGLIAGGQRAMSGRGRCGRLTQCGRRRSQSLNLSDKDVLVGIARAGARPT